MNEVSAVSNENDAKEYAKILVDGALAKSNKKKHLMIDLETLGKPCDSVVLSIGAIAFDMDGTVGPKFERFPVVEDQLSYRKVEWTTIQWWMKQEYNARMSIIEATRIQKLKECLVDLKNFCIENLDENFRVWANGASFDTAFLNLAYSQFDMETPWSYKRQMDCRTICWLSKISTKNYESSGVKHNALDDCEWQISWTVDAFKILNDF